jgi:hypothetical protein
LYAQHGEVSLAAAATHVLITLIDTSTSPKEIEKLLSEGWPR